MIYLISGASRAGKSLLAQRLAKKTGLSVVSLDWIMMGFTNGVPEFGIHDKLMPEEIAQRLWPFLGAMLESMVLNRDSAIIEGEAMLPELLITLMKKPPVETKSCFLGFADVDPEQKAKDIKAYTDRELDWLFDKSDAYILDHVHNMIRHSRLIKASCKKHDIKYLETSKDFVGAMDEALEYLMPK